MGYRTNHGQLLSRQEVKQRYRECKYKRQLDIEYENWDIIYGDNIQRYSVYVLTDTTKPGLCTYGPLTFTHEPFYVGSGIMGRRVKESMSIGRQMEREYSYKIQRMLQIKQAGGTTMRYVIIGHYFTEEKAKLVERKIIHLIDPITRLSNSVRLFCDIPLTPYDCNVMVEAETFIT